jgi:hypothetical protein
MKTYWGSGSIAPRIQWLASRPGCFIPRVSADGTHWIAGCVDRRSGLDAVAKRKNTILVEAGN